MKQVIANLVFAPGAAGAGTVTLSDYTTLRAERVLVVINTTRNVTLYSVTDPTQSLSVSGNVITLSSVDTSSHQSTDKLLVIYENYDNDPISTPLAISRATRIINLSYTASGVGSSIDCTNYASISVQCLATGGSGTFVFSGSNDNITWTLVALLNAASVGSGTPTTGGSATGIYSGPINFKYFRVQPTLVSGTQTHAVLLSSTPWAAPTSQINAAVTQMSPANTQTTQTAATLAASATFTGTSTQSSNSFSKLRMSVIHAAGTIHGHLTLEESNDGTTWWESWRCPVPSDNGKHTFERPYTEQYWRVKFINGGVAQTAFRLVTETMRLDGDSGVSKKNLNFPIGNTALTASAVNTSVIFDLGLDHNWDRMRVFVRTDQSGTVQVRQSSDGSSFSIMPASDGSQNVVAGGNFLETKIAARYLQVVLTNGATAQTLLNYYATLISL